MYPHTVLSDRRLDCTTKKERKRFKLNMHSSIKYTRISKLLTKDILLKTDWYLNYNKNKTYESESYAVKSKNKIAPSFTKFNNFDIFNLIHVIKN